MMSSPEQSCPNRNYVRILGFLFLFSVLFPIFNTIFVLSSLTSAGDAIATADNIVTNISLFRISIVSELLLSISGTLTAFFLYALLKPVDKNLAALGFAFRLIEAALMAVIGLFGFIALQAIYVEKDIAAFSPGQIRNSVGHFAMIHTSLIASFPMLFLGLGLVLFNYLFFKSRYIPRILSGLGFLSYSLIFAYAFMNILVPEHSGFSRVMCWAPSVIYEPIIGLWLVAKGVDSRNGAARSSEAVASRA